MKSLLRLLATLAILLAGPVAFAADAAHAEKEEKADTELTKKMDNIKRAFRQLKKQAGDAAKNEDSIKQVAVMQENATAAAKLDPLKATEVPKAESAKLIAGYREEMKEFLKMIAQLGDAFKAGNNAEAQKIIGQLGDLQKEGHKEYKSKSID